MLANPPNCSGIASTSARCIVRMGLPARDNAPRSCIRQLETNDTTGSVLTLQPVGVLPNNATVRVIVEQTLDHGAPSGIGQGLKGEIERLGLIL